MRWVATYNEAATHCDVLVNSICETRWKSLLSDIAKEKISSNGQKALYITDRENRFQYPENFHESSADLKWYQYPSVPTAVGCPYDCSFCSPFMPGRYVPTEIRTIYREIARIKRKIVFLCDATFAVNKRSTINLMKLLAPLEKRFMVETSLERLKDRELLEALALGGVKWIIVGIESLSLKLKKHGTSHLEEDLKRAVEHAHECGVFIQGSIICGLDGDGPESFNRIYQLYDKSGMDSLLLDILVPYPNTGLYEKLRMLGRLD